MPIQVCFKRAAWASSDDKATGLDVEEPPLTYRATIGGGGGKTKTVGTQRIAAEVDGTGSAIFSAGTWDWTFTLCSKPLVARLLLATRWSSTGKIDLEVLNSYSVLAEGRFSDTVLFCVFCIYHTANRFRPMHVDRSISDFDAVSGAHRKSKALVLAIVAMRVARRRAMRKSGTSPASGGRGGA